MDPAFFQVVFEHYKQSLLVHCFFNFQFCKFSFFILIHPFYFFSLIFFFLKWKIHIKLFSSSLIAAKQEFQLLLVSGFKPRVGFGFLITDEMNEFIFFYYKSIKLSLSHFLYLNNFQSSFLSQKKKEEAKTGVFSGGFGGHRCCNSFTQMGKFSLLSFNAQSSLFIIIIIILSLPAWN